MIYSLQQDYRDTPVELNIKKEEKKPKKKKNSKANSKDNQRRNKGKDKNKKHKMIVIIRKIIKPINKKAQWNLL